MTHAEKIMQAVAAIVEQKGRDVFTRDEIRQQIGVDRQEWKASYTAVFQSMREDHPGGALNVRGRFKNVFRRVGHGRHTLSNHGQELLQRY